MVTWVLDYLTSRPQHVWLCGNESNPLWPTEVYPKELFCPRFYSPTLYTCHLQTFPDDSALVGFIHKDNHIAYQQNIDDIVTCWNENHLILEDQGAYYWF